jgi:hypothetical protein
MTLQPVTDKQKINPAGRVYGRLTVTKLAGYIIETRNKEKGTTNRVAVYSCRCECGNELDVRARDLKRGMTKSCGCLHKETSSQNGKNNKLPDSENSALNLLYYRYKSNAKQKKRNFELSLEQFKELTSKNCFYCGLKPQTSAKTLKKELASEYKYNGLDKIDPLKHYSIDNVVTCCSQCNYSKLDYSQKEFLTWVKRIAEYQNFCK